MPLSAFTHYETKNTALAVNHQGQFPAVTISFNLGEGVALGDAVTKIEAAVLHMGLPADIHPTFQGNARAFQSSLASQPWLILAALVAVYIVLGMLYESYIHPITILSTLPSAGVGALLALLAFHTELTVIALIGIILLIGIVKKNAIMMIDFAIEAERTGKTPEESIYQACLLRFRPIMMTTVAALFGGLPLALMTGTGSEMRRPLGISIVGGLMVSQALLFTRLRSFICTWTACNCESRGAKRPGFSRRPDNSASCVGQVASCPCANFYAICRTHASEEAGYRSRCGPGFRPVAFLSA